MAADLLERLQLQGGEQPCVIDQPVDAAELLFARANYGRHLFLVDHVGLVEDIDAQILQQRERIVEVHGPVGVLAEHACHGNTGSAPIVRDVILAYMQKYHPELIKAQTATSIEEKSMKVEPEELIE